MLTGNDCITINGSKVLCFAMFLLTCSYKSKNQFIACYEKN